MVNHPNRSKHTMPQTQKHTPDWQLRALKAESLNAELLAALNGLLNCFNSSGEIEETTQDQLSVALENAEKAQAKAEGR